MLLSIQSVGVCGSDIHFWVDGKIGDFMVESPMILGHEASAMVVGVGEGVTHLNQGKLLHTKDVKHLLLFSKETLYLVCSSRSCLCEALYPILLQVTESP